MNDYNWRINNEKENTERRLDIVTKEKVKSKKEIKNSSSKERKEMNEIGTNVIILNTKN